MKKYLVLLPNNLGDVIMALPVLEALKKKRDNYITFFVEDGFEGGVLNCNFYDELYLFQRKKIKNLIKSELWRDGIEKIRLSVKNLQDRQFDVVINLCQSRYVSIISGLFECESFYGRHFLKDGCHSIPDLWSSYLYAVPYARRCNNLHSIDIYKRIAGVPDVFSRGEIELTSNEYRNASAFLKDKGKPDSKKIVLVHPGAAYESKMWPVENYIHLSRKLIEHGMWIVITGSKNESNIANTIKEKVGSNCIVASGMFSFRESLAFAGLSDLCITGDTAMMHASNALNKKVFALFGPTNPVETGPYGDGHIIFAGRCSRRPCFCFECHKNECMKSINPEIIFEMITNGVVKNSSCDIYTTKLGCDGTFSLMPIIEQGLPYFDKNRSEFIRKSFDSCHRSVSFQKNDYQDIIDEQKSIIKIILSMEQMLQEYLLKKEISYIHSFENLRSELNQKNGIAEFFMAVLNIGLNGISLINPILAVNESLKACKKIRLMLENMCYEM